ncbi:MAG: hypothetical protein KF757_04985 [Phycisphaeraceae bacterium]|nr:hypothetical protein [Phycisphaeraceae bacterium]MCW5763878.1 hypothetical protein [Phycisphaeraceae bacterium]
MTNLDPNNSDTTLEADLERLFDRELSREERAALKPRLEQDPQAALRFRQTTRVILALREPLAESDMPDLAAAALTHTPLRLRRKSPFSTSRLAIAAGLIGLGAAGALILTQPHQPQPFTPVLRAERTSPTLELLTNPELAARELAAITLTQPLPQASHTSLVDARTFPQGPHFSALSEPTFPIAAQLSNDPIEFATSSLWHATTDATVFEPGLLFPTQASTIPYIDVPFVQRQPDISTANNLLLRPVPTWRFSPPYDWSLLLQPLPFTPPSLDLGRPANDN